MFSQVIPEGVLHSFENIPVTIFPTEQQAVVRLAAAIADRIKASKGGTFKLGLTCGKTPVGLYKELVRLHGEGEVSFANVEIFTMEEYYPCCDDDKSSERSQLHSMLLDHIDIPAANIHCLDGGVPRDKVGEYCAQYDKDCRELDLICIGIGHQGQIAFNEAGSSSRSRTRTVMMSYQSRKQHAKSFNRDIYRTPKAALTVGLGTMKDAKEIILMAWGEDKAPAVHDVCEAKWSPSCPASWLQKHENISMWVDENASSCLTRVEAPWLVGECDWTQPRMVRKALVWLCGKVEKPILKLTYSDYTENGLGELLEATGRRYDDINISVFNDMQHTITGWPGGKPNADDSTRPVKSLPFPKKVVIFSPHPDDDVISMGGTFIRLVEQGHDVHVAYETSGNVAVHDDVVLQHMDAARELGLGDKMDLVRELIASKKPSEPEPRALLDIKAAIRRSEARAAVASFGLNPDTNAHFLNLPFYESGGIKKNPRSQKDVDIIKALLVQVQPDQIYLAGDLADPHGTHRVCTQAVLDAVSQLRSEGERWLEGCTIWLYRGAWMEWELDKVDMAVPLSPDEVIKKRHAIFRHLSQKDIVPFPGDDSREFWQRAEDRTQRTARLYDAIGMAEYQAMEVFVRYENIK